MLCLWSAWELTRSTSSCSEGSAFEPITANSPNRVGSPFRRWDSGPVFPDPTRERSDETPRTALKNETSYRLTA